MILFIDASALTAIIVDEFDAETFLKRLEQLETRLISGIAMWETAMAVARIKRMDAAIGWTEVERFVASLEIAVVPIDMPVAAEALSAQRRYGKGTGHPARLNMGDCFAYACAKTNNARLLYKGDDFVHTDLA